MEKKLRVLSLVGVANVFLLFAYNYIKLNNCTFSPGEVMHLVL